MVPSEKIGHEAAQLLSTLMSKKSKGRTKPVKPVLIAPTGVVANRSTDTLAISDPDLVQALLYIRDHACNSMQIADVLRAVPISRRTIERKFAEVLGRTPAQEIRRIRMAKAKKLIAETDLTMDAIAESCGYGTYNYLTRIFTRENGITPREFRKQSQVR
jgi:LacI family transcriptional regulator